jgi:enoyl-CoA hydratase/carnithine racemase
MSDTILTEKLGMVTVVYLNRPQTLNCFNNELLESWQRPWIRWMLTRRHAVLSLPALAGASVPEAT